MRAAVVIAALIGCGGSAEPAEPAELTPALPSLALDATATAPDDAVVARVDGHPIYASCVTAQAAHDHLDVRAALRECVDFELLARAAAARGLADAPDVREAQHAALVDRVVERGFEDHVFSPSDMGPLWDKVAKKLGYKYDHPEYRASSYVRVTINPGATPADEAAAHAAMEQVAAAVAGQTGLMAVDLVDIATPIAAAAHVQLDHADVGAFIREGLDKPYADALFALPDIGRASAAVRTKYGWDVVLYTNVITAEHDSADATIAGLMPDARRAYFTHWVGDLGAAMQVTKYPDQIPDDEDGK